MDPSHQPHQPPPSPADPYAQSPNPYAQPHDPFAPGLPAGAPPVPGYPPGTGYPPPYGGLYAPPPAPPRVWPVFVAYLIAFGPGCIAGVFVAIVAALIIHGPQAFQSGPPVPSDPDSTYGAGSTTAPAAVDPEAMMREPGILLPMLLTLQLVLLAVSLAGGILSPTPLKRRLRLVRAVLPWYGYAIVAVGTLAFGYSSGVLIELLGLGEEGVLEEFEKAIAGMRGVTLFLTALVIGLGPAFGEEFLLRGYMQTRLAQRWTRMTALFITSLLFGVLHMDLVQGTMAVGMGLFLGEVADRTGSIWPAVAGHAFNNTVATVIGAYFGGLTSADPAAGDVAAGTAWQALLVSVPVFLLCLLYVLRRPVAPTPYEPPPAPLTPAPPVYMPPTAGPVV